MLLFKLALLLTWVLVCSSRSIAWTGGAGNGLWNFAGNWQGNTVPTSDDDVFINAVGGATVSVSQPAVALSVSIGGGTYPQQLNLLSQLTVGTGGISVQSQGTLQISSNNDLPLISRGRITIFSNGILSFTSGAIVDSAVVVNSGAGLLFSTSALKLISGSTVTVYGYVTIQPSTIQFTRSGSLVNSGNLTAVGQITLFTSDATGSFVNYGNFTYQGNSNTQPLDFQVPTYFSTDLQISSGAVTLSSTFVENATISLPSGSVLTISGGPSIKTISSVRGSGSLVVQGTVVFTAVQNIEVLTVTDSGDISFRTTAVVRQGTFSGRVTIATTLIVLQGALAGGTVMGPGNLTSTQALSIQPSEAGNTNNFISTLLYVQGNATISRQIFILLSDAGNLRIARGAYLFITASTTVNVQSGSPVITTDGTISVSLPSGGAVVTNVNFAGQGSLSLASGKFEFDADVVSFGAVNVGAGALLDFETARFSLGDITGTGSVNVTAAPSPLSSFGRVSVSYLGIPNGNIQAVSIAVGTLDFWNGFLTLSAGSTNTADTFRWYGGTLSGVAKLTSKTITVRGTIPQILNGTVVTTNAFSLTCVSACTFLSENNAQLVSGSTLFSAPALIPGKASIRDD